MSSFLFAELPWPNFVAADEEDFVAVELVADDKGLVVDVVGHSVDDVDFVVEADLNSVDADDLESVDAVEFDFVVPGSVAYFDVDVGTDSADDSVAYSIVAGTDFSVDAVEPFALVSLVVSHPDLQHDRSCPSMARILKKTDIHGGAEKHT